METDLDPFIDILPEPAVTNARAGGKFQPKAKPKPKPRPRKESSESVPSVPLNAVKEKPDTVAPSCSETTQSIQPVDITHNSLSYPVCSSVATADLLETKESSKNIEGSFSVVPISDDLELANPLSQLVATMEELGSTDALPSEVARSDNNNDWHSSLGKSTVEADSMGFEMDLVDDILADPVTSNAKASSKFLPKAKHLPKKDSSSSVHSTLPNAKKDNPDSLASTGSDTTPSVKPADVSDNRLKDPVGSFPGEPLEDNKGSFLDDNRSSGLIDPLSQLGVIKEDAGSRDALCSEVAISDYYDSMGFDLDPFAEVLPEPAKSNARAGGKFQPKAKHRHRKETSASVTPAISNATKDKLVELASAGSEIHGSTLENYEGSFSGVPFSDNDGSLRLVNPASHLVAADALHLEVAMADGNGDRHSSLQKSAGENADIFSGLEYLDVFLSQSTTSTVSAANKSQLNIDTNTLPRNKLLTSYPFDSDGRDSVCPSKTPTFHASNSEETEGDPGVPAHSSVDSLAFRACDAAQVHSFPEISTTQDPVTCNEAAVSSNDGDFQIDSGRVETEETGAFPSLETLVIMSEATITSGRRTSKFLPKHQVPSKKGKHAASSSHPDAFKSVICPPDAQLVHSETVDMDEGSFPAFTSYDDLDFSSVRFSDSTPTDPTSELLVNKEPTNLVDTSHLDAAIPGDVGYSEAAPEMLGKVSAKSRKRKFSTIPDVSREPQKSSIAGEENENGESSRQLRKHRAARDLATGSEDGAYDNGSFPAEPPNSVEDEAENNDEEYRVENASQKKRAQRKCKKTVAENGKPVRKRKKSGEESDQATKEPPKKFSHSTRRNKRRVDKTLLETPEDEIDLQKLPIKDLIMLAEFRERTSNKEATVSKTSSTNQSVENSFCGDAPDNEEETFASEQDRGSNDDEDNIRVQPSSSYFNYQSYMDKTPSARWSKQETELFYEAVQQFGTDFSMVQQLFPGRTRNQIKLKYKKEERQHPLRLSEAVKNRAKDHSHFQLLIERLQHAAQAEQNANGDDSIGVTGEEEEEEEEAEEVAEEVTSETNEAPKSEENEAAVAEEQEADVADDHSPMKLDESDDDLERWSQYKSEW